MSVFVAGQSLAKIFLEHNRGEFAQAVAELAPDRPPPVLWGHAVGSTVAASTNVFPTPGKAGKEFWWDMAADAPGPLLRTALDVQGPSPAEALFWDLGQHEAVLVRGRLGREPESVARDFRYATLRILGTLRQHLRPEHPGSLPILLMRIGPMKAHPKFDHSGIARIRAIQAEIIDAVPNCHDAGDISAMELKDGVHPTHQGSKHYLRVVAATFARVMGERRAAA